MVPIMSLWLPIVAAAGLVFLASFVVHMVLPYHRNDFDPLPREDMIMDALRPFAIPPGEYVLPHLPNPAALKDPVYREKVQRGPVAFMTVLPGGMPGMGRQLALWFLYW